MSVDHQGTVPSIIIIVITTALYCRILFVLISKAHLLGNMLLSITIAGAQCQTCQYQRKVVGSIVELKHEFLFVHVAK